MTKEFTCPRCRSVIQLIGSVDFNPVALQTLNCSVCGQKWWLASDWSILKGYGYKWSVGKILERHEPPENTKPVPVPEPPDTKIWSDFSIIEPLQNLGKGLYNIGIWIIAILILWYLIKRR